MDERIIKFIRKQTCASLCCVDESGFPYCFSCFYAFDANRRWLVFKSSPSSHHMKLLGINPAVAGTIQSDRLNLFKVAGVQFEGKLVTGEIEFIRTAKAGYYKKHPVGISVPGDIHIISLQKIKFTDYKLGIGIKLNWDSETREAAANLH